MTPARVRGLRLLSLLVPLATAGCRTDLQWEPPSVDAGADLSSAIDLAAPPGDLAGTLDFATALDFAAPPDFALGTPDIAVPPDFSLGPPDIAILPDLAPRPDFAVPPDLVTPLDLTPPPDMAQPPSCRDGQRNGNETDVDCGGGTCNACIGGAMCKSNSDCLGGTCDRGLCHFVFALGAASVYPAGGDASALAVADFDADGAIDVAASGSVNPFLGVFLGRGDGTLRPVKLVTAPPQPGTMAASDLDGDGRPDLVTASGAGSIAVLLSTGGGAFGNAVVYKAGVAPTRIAIADLDADGRGDVVVANRGVVNGDPGSLGIFRGQGGGALVAMATVPAGVNPDCVAIADLDRDGALDLAVGNLAWAGTVQVLLGDGKGAFATAMPFLASGNPYSVAASDFDRDGTLDLAVVNAGTQDVSVLRGLGSGRFATRIDTPAGQVPTTAVVADLDIDGRPDVAVLNSLGARNTITILFGRGDGTFASPLTITAGSGTGDIAVADFNRDNKPDLIVTDSAGNGVAVLLNTSR